MTRYLQLSIVWLCGAAAAFGVVPSAANENGNDVDLAVRVRSIFSQNCYHCHGPDEKTREADLRLDDRDDVFRDRGGYAAVRRDKLDESEVYQRIVSTDEDLQMPPPESKLALTSDEIDAVARWIQSGASWTGHWAYEPIRRPDLPTDVAVDWSKGYEGPRNGIDWFIVARLDARNGESDLTPLVPSKPAERRRLLRRLSLDLTGLPPTTIEIDAFANDDRPDAYDRAVDRLLASPHYGERMLWDWLDAARYADSSGFQGDPERTMWPWRDWVLHALNANMPFDEFTIEQLAGDLLPNATPAQQIATGFNRNHMHNGEGGRIAEETRVENVFDRVETTATVWMGLTFTCARCHDHKYDPFTQRDYYQLSTFFNNTTENGAGRAGQNAPVVEFRTPSDHAAWLSIEELVCELARDLADFEAENGDRLLKDVTGEPVPGEVRQQLERATNERDADGIDLLLKHFTAERNPSYAVKLTAFQEALRRRDALKESLPKVMVMDERETPRETFVLDRGVYNQRGERVRADVPPGLIANESGHIRRRSPQDRLTLAEWLVDPDHALVSRVVTNRVWQMFFGRGLVATPENFGVQGEKPTHPQLLDWLAADFIDSGWDVKRLHRLIVTSATYRQSSKVEPRAIEGDPVNAFLARGPRYRMPSWMLRDQALAVSGLLVSTLGGPPVKPYQPPGVWSDATFGKKTYEQGDGPELYRRSVYTFWRRIVGPPMFFDASKRQTCDVRIPRTNTPLHALTTLNDPVYLESARVLAQRIMLPHSSNVDAGGRREAGDWIASAFFNVTSRPATSTEREILLHRFFKLRAAFVATDGAADDLLAIGESQRDRSLDVADHAAMTSICLLLFNLDETLTKE